MINKLKIGLLIVVFSLLAVASSANAAALTFSEDTTVTLGGNDYIISQGSGATSVIVGDSTLTVTTDGVTSFTFISPDKFDLNNSVNTTVTCGATTSSITYSAAVTSAVITPNTSLTCEGDVVGGGGGGHSSGGGGGGGSSSNDDDEDEDSTTVEGCIPGGLFSTTTGKACSTVVVGCGVGNLFSPVTGQACGSSVSSTTTTTTTTVGASGYAFGVVTIKLGSRGEACKAWQMFFNAKRNAGLVTDGICGPKTMAAAVAWQASAGLVADGLLGPMSRAKAMMQ